MINFGKRDFFLCVSPWSGVVLLKRANVCREKKSVRAILRFVGRSEAFLKQLSRFQTIQHNFSH
tara:strand:- start:272 stop:463 length:192 start_codon:yes stop_codon:yes gene_type:complete